MLMVCAQKIGELPALLNAAEEAQIAPGTSSTCRSLHQLCWITNLGPKRDAFVSEMNADPSHPHGA